MLLDMKCIYPIARILKEDCFYGHVNQSIFRAILSVYEQDLPVDIISVTQSLKESEEIEKVGGEYFITELTCKVSSSASAEYHAHIVFEYAIRRTLLNACHDIYDNSYSESSDIFELLESVQKLDIEIMGRISASKSRDKLSLLNEYSKYIQTRTKRKKLATGLPTLDKMLKGGLPTGGYSIIGGDAGAGKTSLMLGFALNMAKHGFNVHFIEGEMPSNEIYERMNGIWANTDIDIITSGVRYDQLTKPFLTYMHKIPFHLVKNFNRTIESLVSDIKQAVYKGADMVFIDYLQVFAPREKAENEFSAIKIVSETIRSMSLKHPIHICVASAYTRDGKFYGSKLLDNDATQLFKLTYDKEDEDKARNEVTTPIRDITLEVEKNRSGARGNLPVRYFLDSQKMAELSKEGTIMEEPHHEEPEQLETF
ncbi:MAG: AAA family ATPase [Thermoplasmata archaeon]|nr:AAA family ATPase [Thermoplasmata archaeon]